MPDRYNPEGTKSVGDNWNDDGHADECRSPDGRTIHHQCIETAESNGRDQEPQARAGLSDMERPFGNLNRVTSDVGRNMQEAQAMIDEDRGYVLKVRRQECAERHEEIKVEQWTREPPPQVRAEHREEQQFHKCHRDKLPTLHDA